MNKVEWKDIVKIGNEFYLECFEVEFHEEINEYLGDNEREILKKLDKLKKLIFDPLYNCDKFFDNVREKYSIAEDEDIETYLFNNIDLPDKVYKKFDIAWLGGYINGVNI